MNARDVHDGSTADSLICLLLDLVGGALQHTSTAAKMFRLVWSISGIFGIALDLRSLKSHVVSGCRFVQHESLNHYVTQDSIRRVLSFSVHN